ncbi:hypothetical protein ACRAWF_43085 [Streptomyces sp. L7]
MRRSPTTSRRACTACWNRLGEVAVAVFAADWQLIWWNPGWAALLGDPSAKPPRTPATSPASASRSAPATTYASPPGRCWCPTATTRTLPSCPTCAAPPAATRTTRVWPT